MGAHIVDDHPDFSGLETRRSTLRPYKYKGRRANKFAWVCPYKTHRISLGYLVGATMIYAELSAAVPFMIPQKPSAHKVHLFYKCTYFASQQEPVKVRFGLAARA